MTRSDFPRLSVDLVPSNAVPVVLSSVYEGTGTAATLATSAISHLPTIPVDQITDGLATTATQVLIGGVGALAAGAGLVWAGLNGHLSGGNDPTTPPVPEMTAAEKTQKILDATDACKKLDEELRQSVSNYAKTKKEEKITLPPIGLSAFNGEPFQRSSYIKVKDTWYKITVESGGEEQGLAETNLDDKEVKYVQAKLIETIKATGKEKVVENKETGKIKQVKKTEALKKETVFARSISIDLSQAAPKAELSHLIDDSGKEQDNPQDETLKKVDHLQSDHWKTLKELGSKASKKQKPQRDALQILTEYSRKDAELEKLGCKRKDPKTPLKQNSSDDTILKSLATEPQELIKRLKETGANLKAKKLPPRDALQQIAHYQTLLKEEIAALEAFATSDEAMLKRLDELAKLPSFDSTKAELQKLKEFYEKIFAPSTLRNNAVYQILYLRKQLDSLANDLLEAQVQIYEKDAPSVAEAYKLMQEINTTLTSYEAPGFNKPTGWLQPVVDNIGKLNPYYHQISKLPAPSDGSWDPKEQATILQQFIKNSEGRLKEIKKK